MRPSASCLFQASRERFVTSRAFISLFLWRKRVGTLAQALTREDEVERTFRLKCSRRHSLAAEKYVSRHGLGVANKPGLNDSIIALRARACQIDLFHDSSRNKH